MIYLISMVSEQTIPNILFIKDHPEADRYIFLSTDRMEEAGKTNAILESAGIQNKDIQIIKVSHNNPGEIEDTLKTLTFEDGDEILLNITGGTKIMSLAAYQFFSNRNSRIFYLTLGKNEVNRIFPYPLKEGKINARLNLQEYFSAYGVRIQSSSSEFLRDPEFTRRFKKEIFPESSDIIWTIRELRNKKKVKKILEKKYQISFDHPAVGNFFQEEQEKNYSRAVPMEKIREFLQAIGFNSVELQKDETEFLIGGWLEEYVYSYIKEHTGAGPDNLLMNVTIIRENIKNELDVVFIHQNHLHIIECKTGLRTPFKNILADTIYKQAALRQDFGLDARSYLFTMDTVSDKNHLARAHYMNIALADRKILNDEQDLQNFIANHFNSQ